MAYSTKTTYIYGMIFLFFCIFIPLIVCGANDYNNRKRERKKEQFNEFGILSTSVNTREMMARYKDLYDIQLQNINNVLSWLRNAALDVLWNKLVQLCNERENEQRMIQRDMEAAVNTGLSITIYDHDEIWRYCRDLRPETIGRLLYFVVLPSDILTHLRRQINRLLDMYEIEETIGGGSVVIIADVIEDVEWAGRENILQLQETVNTHIDNQWLQFLSLLCPDSYTVARRQNYIVRVMDQEDASILNELTTMAYNDDNEEFGEPSLLHSQIDNAISRNITTALKDDVRREGEPSQSFEWNILHKLNNPCGLPRNAQYTGIATTYIANMRTVPTFINQTLSVVRDTLDQEQLTVRAFIYLFTDYTVENVDEMEEISNRSLWEVSNFIMERSIASMLAQRFISGLQQNPCPYMPNADPADTSRILLFIGSSFQFTDAYSADLLIYYCLVNRSCKEYLEQAILQTRATMMSIDSIPDPNVPGALIALDVYTRIYDRYTIFDSLYEQHLRPFLDPLFSDLYEALIEHT